MSENFKCISFVFIVQMEILYHTLIFLIFLGLFNSGKSSKMFLFNEKSWIEKLNNISEKIFVFFNIFIFISIPLNITRNFNSIHPSFIQTSQLTYFNCQRLPVSEKLILVRLFIVCTNYQFISQLKLICFWFFADRAPIP